MDRMERSAKYAALIEPTEAQQLRNESARYWAKGHHTFGAGSPFGLRYVKGGLRLLRIAFVDGEAYFFRFETGYLGNFTRFWARDGDEDTLVADHGTLRVRYVHLGDDRVRVSVLETIPSEETA